MLVWEDCSHNKLIKLYDRTKFLYFRFYSNIRIRDDIPVDSIWFICTYNTFLHVSMIVEMVLSFSEKIPYWNGNNVLHITFMGLFCRPLNWGSTINEYREQKEYQLYDISKDHKIMRSQHGMLNLFRTLTRVCEYQSHYTTLCI